MPRKVTYGVAGLIDWNAKIPIGRATLAVHFTGGALTKYGITPAEYTTSDPFVQKVIEDSAYYRNGRISIIRSSGKPDVYPLSNKHDQAKQSAFAGAVLPLEKSVPSASADTEQNVPAGDEVVHVACIEDAIEILRERFGISSALLGTVDKVQSEGAKRGINFIVDE